MHLRNFCPLRPSALRTFNALVLTTLFWSIFFGGYKFLIKNLAADELGRSGGHLLEQALLFLSIGGLLAFLLGGVVCRVSNLRTIVMRDALAAIALVLLHYSIALASYPAFAITCMTIGLFYGVFAVVRSVAISIEMQKSGLRDTVVNGVPTMALMFGIIGGAYMSTTLYEDYGTVAFWVFVALLLCIVGTAQFLEYEPYQHRSSGRQALRDISRHVLPILRKGWCMLSASATIWAVATIVSIISIPYAQERFGTSESTSSLVLLASAMGAIGGNALTALVRRKGWWFGCAALSFSVLVMAFPFVTTSFTALVILSIVIGVCMGAATNLVDSAYLHMLSDNGWQESGAALTGLLLNAIMAGLLGATHWLPFPVQFSCLGMAALLLVLPRIRDNWLSEAARP